MTDEAQGLTPDEAPVPPASTRWSEDAVADDDAPPPPFVPGRGEPPAAATPGAEPATGEGAPESGGAPAQAEPFPFEMPLEEGEADEEEALAAADSAEYDFPFEQFDIEGRGEEVQPSDRPEAAATAERIAPAPAAPAAEDAATDVAALLEYLADMVRSEGEAGVRRELDSPDRLTAVLAGILAGYFSGRS